MRGFSLMVLLILAACSQQAADVVDRSQFFYGREGPVSKARMLPEVEVEDQREYALDPEIAHKYKEERASYAERAAVPSVAIEELDEPVNAVDDAPAQSDLVERAIRVVEIEEKRDESEPVTLVTYSASEHKEKAKPSMRELSELAALASISRSDKPEVYTNVRKKTVEVDKKEAVFIWPVRGQILSRYGPKPNGLINDGINIEASEGEPIWAAAGGKVIYAGNKLKGYGNMAILLHKDQWMTAYGHASELLVKKGDKLKQGDLIGYVGSTGHVKRPQLHFGMRRGEASVDPELILPQDLASTN